MLESLPLLSNSLKQAKHTPLWILFGRSQAHLRLHSMTLLNLILIEEMRAAWDTSTKKD